MSDAHKAPPRGFRPKCETFCVESEAKQAPLIRQPKAVEYPLAVLENQFAEEILVKAMLLLYFLVLKVAKLILGVAHRAFIGYLTLGVRLYRILVRAVIDVRAPRTVELHKHSEMLEKASVLKKLL